MNSANTFKWTTIIMVVVNVALISFMFMNRPGQPSHHGPEQNKHLIIDRLGFNKQQISEYNQLIEAHKTAIAKADDEIMKAKRMLYELLLRDDEVARDKFIDKVNKEQRNIEHVHFNHFKAIQALCNQDQKAEFEKLSKDLGRMFGAKNGMKPKEH